MQSWRNQRAIIREDQKNTYNNIIAKYTHAEPATGRIARQIEARNERANQSVIALNDIRKISTGFGTTSRGNVKFNHPWGTNE